MKILLGVTGSIAAKLNDKLVDQLLSAGHEVRVVYTEAARNFAPNIGDRNVVRYNDESEWDLFKKRGKVLHIDLVKWADAFLIAPCTANTLRKISLGLCDNLVTNCGRAWDYKKKMIIAPAMNTQMWEHPALEEDFKKVVHVWGALWVPPTIKTLYCGDTGVGAMANIFDIVTCVNKSYDGSNIR